MSLLYQHIEQMSRDKGVDAAIILEAVEDAILTAAKKYYGTEEPYQARFNEESGQVEVFHVKRVVERVTSPETEITLKDAKSVVKSAKLGSDVELHKPTDVAPDAQLSTFNLPLSNDRDHPQTHSDRHRRR